MRVDDFFSRMWLRNALRRMILPVPVILKRLAAPRWVFILGMWFFVGLGVVPRRSSLRRRCVRRSAVSLVGGSWSRRRLGRSRRLRWPRRLSAMVSASVGLGRVGRLGGLGSVVAASASRCSRPRGRLGLLVGSEHHDHVATVELGDDLDPAGVAPRLGDVVEDAACPSSGCCISRPRNMIVTLTLWPSLEELLDLAGLGVEVARADLRAVLHLLDGRRSCSCAGTPWPSARPRTCTCRSP